MADRLHQSASGVEQPLGGTGAAAVRIGISTENDMAYHSLVPPGYRGVHLELSGGPRMPFKAHATPLRIPNTDVSRERLDAFGRAKLHHILDEDIGTVAMGAGFMMSAWAT